MYKLKININERCNLIEEDNCEAWMWHKRFYHQSFYTLQDMVRGNLAKGLPHFQTPDEVCANCTLDKYSRALFFFFISQRFKCPRIDAHGHMWTYKSTNLGRKEIILPNCR